MGQEISIWSREGGDRTLRCRKLVETTLKEFGQLDILVNNASMQEDKKESFIGRDSS